MIIGTNGVHIAFAVHRRFHGRHHRWRIFDQTMEEAAEVIQAIQKFRREPSSSNLERLKAEIADLTLCIDFISRAEFGDAELKKRVTDLAVILDQKLSAVT